MPCTTLVVKAPAPTPPPPPPPPPGAPSWAVTAVGIYPSTAQAGDSTQLYAEIKNTGTASGTATVTIKLDGTTMTTQSVSLAPGSSKTVSVYWTATAGSHTISATADSASASATFTIGAKLYSVSFNVTYKTSAPIDHVWLQAMKGTQLIFKDRQQVSGPGSGTVTFTKNMAANGYTIKAWLDSNTAKYVEMSLGVYGDRSVSLSIPY